ncbi:MAG: energy transducer TonB [Myxococcota bacterium]
MRHAFPILLVAISLLPAVALASEPTDVTGAREFLDATLKDVQSARWKQVKARIHPATLRSMEERRKRTGRDNHNLALWHHAKESRLKRFEIVSVEPGPRNTAVVVTREDHYLLAERGHDLGRESSWLLLRTDAHRPGKPQWVLLDRRHGADSFTPESIVAGYASALPAVRAEAPRTPLGKYQAQLERAVRTRFTVPEDIPDHQRRNMACSVRLMLDENGSVLSRTVVKASGNPRFDHAVIKGIDAANPLPPPDPALKDEAENGVVVRFDAADGSPAP